MEGQQNSLDSLLQRVGYVCPPGVSAPGVYVPRHTIPIVSAAVERTAYRPQSAADCSAPSVVNTPSVVGAGAHGRDDDHQSETDCECGPSCDSDNDDNDNDSNSDYYNNVGDGGGDATATKSFPPFTIAGILAQANANRKARETPKQLEAQERLRKAHNALVEKMYEKIVTAITYALMRDPKATRTKVFNAHNDVDLQGLPHLYVIRGGHDKEKNTYDRHIHHFAGIDFNPIEEVQARMRKYGSGVKYVQDVSDHRQSKNWVLEVVWVLPEKTL